MAWARGKLDGLVSADWAGLSDLGVGQNPGAFLLGSPPVCLVNVKRGRRGEAGTGF